MPNLNLFERIRWGEKRQLKYATGDNIEERPYENIKQGMTIGWKVFNKSIEEMNSLSSQFD